MQVTDHKWKDDKGNDRIGYYMDEFLALNLMLIPGYLEQAWDVVGIVSGHGLVRVGKSVPKSSNIKVIENGFIVDKQIGSFKDKEKIKTLSYNFNTKQNIISDSEVIEEKEDKDFYEVTLQDNKRIQCSMEHKLFVFENGIIKEKKLKDIKEKDLLICKKEKLDKSLYASDIAEQTINQFNIKNINNIREAKLRVRSDNNIINFIIPQLQTQEEKLQEWNIGTLPENLEAVKITSIKFYSKEKGYDLCTDIYHNFFLSNGILSHNSTMALQIGLFTAWLNSGGLMVKNEETGKWHVGRNPKKEVHFTLEENVVFNPDELQKAARDLYKKYGRNQVIIYDEGRAGLDSAAAMSAINKAMVSFFQECGIYGHVILIVLPNFFKLHEDYAVCRSLFLVDVYTNRELKRGYFSFYNTRQKEWLYCLGKKLIGSTIKYENVKCRPSFKGRYTMFLPFSKDKYEELKREAIRKKQVSNYEKKWRRQRDAAIYLLKQKAGVSLGALARDLTIISGYPITEIGIQECYKNITGRRYEKDEVDIKAEEEDRVEAGAETKV